MLCRIQCAFQVVFQRNKDMYSGILAQHCSVSAKSDERQVLKALHTKRRTRISEQLTTDIPSVTTDGKTEQAQSPTLLIARISCLVVQLLHRHWKYGGGKGVSFLGLARSEGHLFLCWKNVQERQKLYIIKLHWFPLLRFNLATPQNDENSTKSTGCTQKVDTYLGEGKF